MPAVWGCMGRKSFCLERIVMEGLCGWEKMICDLMRFWESSPVD